jgi:hypothetical protein
LFVNLNYHVPGYDLVGPELVVNPTPSPEHDATLFGTNGEPRTLREAFEQDLKHTRQTLKTPTEIEPRGS